MTTNLANGLAAGVGSSGFVTDLALVLGVAAVISLLFRLIRQPAILGYLFAGLVVGPYLPIPIFADAHRVEALSEFGVVLVMFAVGLELRIARLFKVLPVSGLTALVQIGALLWLGYTCAQLLGWSPVESVFLGSCLCISSTMVVSKVFEQQPVQGPVREHVFGVLVLQDVVAVALIAALTAVAAGQGLSAAALAGTVGRLVAVLVAMVAGGLLIVPRFMRLVARLDSAEVLVVSMAGVCFGFAYLATELGYSVALGGFVAGVLVAESGRGEAVEHQLQPLRDVFAAVFFVSVGMSVDPLLALENGPMALLIVVVVVVGQLVSVSLAGVLSGNGLRRSVVAGLALGQIGEFAFVIVAIGVAGGVVRPELRPIVVSVAVVTAFTTPLLLSLRERVLHIVDHALPRRLQLLIVMYETWIEKLRARDERGERRRLRRVIAAITLDGLGLLAIAIGVLTSADRLADWLAQAVGLSVAASRWALLAAALALCVPLVIGLLRSTRGLGGLIADAVLTTTSAPADTQAVVVRRLLVVAIQAVVLLGVGIPGAALLRPFMDLPYVAIVVAAGAVVAGYYLWVAAGRVDEEVRASSVQLLEMLASQSAPPVAEQVSTRDLLLGVDSVLGVCLDPTAHAVGKTLAELDLRARTGASVIAIHRSESDVTVPTGRERLGAGDQLALTGTRGASERARLLLLSGLVPAEPSAADSRNRLSGPSESG